MYELIDGPSPERCRELLAEDLRFSIVFSNGPGAAQDFAGGREAFNGYLSQRGTPTWTHHVLTETAHGGVEVVLGETRQDGAPLATFVAAARVDADGRMDRYVVGRSTAVLFGL
jgi:hypothetical protein